MNFMFPVPEASVPAVEICSDRSAAGITKRAMRTFVDYFNRREKIKECEEKYELDVGNDRALVEIHTFLSHWDTVVLKENDLQATADVSVTIDDYDDAKLARIHEEHGHPQELKYSK